MYSCAVASDDVHIYWWSTAEVRPEDQTVLSGEERNRAARFIAPGAAGRYIAAHAGMRRHLARYLGIRARAVRFAEASGGKPYLPDAPDLQFSLSHSGPWALLACSHEHAVGADVEALVDARRITASLQHQSLCTEERDELQRLPPAQHSERFTRWWTAKEAVMKLCGLGLQLPPTAIEIVMQDDALHARLAHAWRRAIPTRHTMRVLDAPDGYVATLAVARATCVVREMKTAAALQATESHEPVLEPSLSMAV